jgi:hypothetical protein
MGDGVRMFPLAETSAGPTGPILIVVVVAVMLFTFRRALRSRSQFARVRKGPLYGGSVTARAPGSAAAIADAGQIPSQELLGALAVVAASEDEDESEDGGTGERLGLRYHRARHGAANLWDPIVYDGTRNGHDVFIRLNRNASVRGPGLNFRRDRSLCVVRVAVPEFVLVSADGRLRAESALPEQATTLLAGLSPSPDVWHDLRVVAGPEGLVASRGVSQDWVGGWVYDLWLLERLALGLGGRALPATPLGRDWVPPYEMDTWAPGAAESYTRA